jgi:hypothetical protein
MAQIQIPEAPVSADDLLCPLCDYDLRGQIEPRCPECGYTFEWEDLRDPARRKHKYLFEHHPERNIRSFIRTTVGGLLPRRFWTGLLPSQPSRPRRLAIYALVIALAGVLPIALYALREVTAAWTEASSVRRQWKEYLATGPGTQMTQQRFPGQSIPKILDQLAPRPSLGAILRQTKIGRMLSYLVVVQALPILWIAFTLASLTLLQVSLYNARMRQIHLVRCVVYCADAFLWSQLLLAAMLLIFILRTITANRIGRMSVWWNDDDLVLGAFAWGFAALWPVFCYRLIIAFKKYLHFSHPISTILLTQLLVFLAVAVALVVMMG